MEPKNQFQLQADQIEELRKTLDDTKWEYAEKQCEVQVADSYYDSPTEDEIEMVSQVMFNEMNAANKKAAQAYAAFQAKQATAPTPIKETKMPEVYVPKMSNDGRLFLRRMIEAIGEDESRRLIAKLNDLIIDRQFSVSEYIDNKIVEFCVTRE